MTYEFDDDSLVRQAQAGYLDAFAMLVERHQVRVFGVALRMLGNRDDAQDVAQDTFVRAWQGLGRFRGDSAFSTWLYRIVTNQSLALLRERVRTEPVTADWLAAMPAPAGRPEEIVEARDRQVTLVRAIVALTPEQRAVLVLREFEGCSYDEIAVTLGITVAAVKSRLHRGRLELLDVMRAWT